MKIAIGRRAPKFILPDQEKSQKDLKNFSGKWLVLYFYPKDNTPGCTLEARDFTRLADRFREVGANIVGVSSDSVDSHCGFIEKEKLNITLLSDTKKEVLKKYGVWQEKNLYGRKSMGVVRTTYLINPDGAIAHIWNKVKAEGHAEEVLNTLKSLQKP